MWAVCSSGGQKKPTRQYLRRLRRPSDGDRRREPVFERPPGAARKSHDRSEPILRPIATVGSLLEYCEMHLLRNRANCGAVLARMLRSSRMGSSNVAFCEMPAKHSTSTLDSAQHR